jgi:type IV secretion/conjugal transfer VirB4 family ATPase
MLNLKVFRSTAPGLPDILPWAALVANGVCLNKDGSVTAGWFYRGADMDSSPDSRLNWASDRVNAALSRLGGGWSLWVDAVRMPAPTYFRPEDSHFPDAISAMIEDERRQHFMASGQHFETEYALLVNYMPPIRTKGRLLDLIYSGEDEQEKSPALDILASFERTLSELEDALSSVLTLRRMADTVELDVTGKRQLRSELLNYLHFTLTGQEATLNVPASGCYLDALIGGVECFPGNTPLVGTSYVAVVAIMGFPAESVPGILAVLDVLQVPLRFTSRFIFTDQPEAKRQIISIERKWKQRLRGFWADVLKLPAPRVDQDALEMANEAGAALARTNSALVGTGYYTPLVVLTALSSDQAVDYARVVQRELMRLGFASRLETINAMEAWLGGLPGHTVPNVRRPLMHTDNLADLLPLTAVWTGRPTNPCPFYPVNSPALLQAATHGAAPFWLNIHINDVGHVLIFGPIGTGKSTLLATIIAQARRYPGMRIWAFDKGRSAMAITKGCGGQHYEIGDSRTLAFCPLSILETDMDAAWAEEWIASCFHLQFLELPTPAEREQIHHAISRMRASNGGRSLTNFVAEVQAERVRDAMNHYTLEGPLGRLLDAEADGLTDGPLMTFEIDELMGMGERQLIPVLLYLFRRFERSLHGQPSLLILDEAWIMLGHQVFREKIREWLKVLRKANCGVVMATQSISDATRSGILDVIVDSCPTKIFLPNSEASTRGTAEVPGPASYYLSMGLNETQLETISSATPKKHYYVLSPEGCRLIELQLGPKTLAFVGPGSKEQLARINELEARYGKDWPQVWLQETVGSTVTATERANVHA